MNRLTAHRNFANPGYSPTKGRIRIYNNRWYLCTFQNIERGRGDYLGLGEGEYTEVLPGKEARQARDAHLNHLNHLVEYKGPIYHVTANKYWQSDNPRHLGWFASAMNAEKAAEGNREYFRTYRLSLSANLANYRARYAERGESWIAESIKACQRAIEAADEQGCWPINVSKVR